MTAGLPGKSASAWAQQMLAAQALRIVVEGLAPHGIPVLPIKGVVTARTLYDDVAARPVRDVDVRLCRSDFARAVAIGRARGWHKLHVALLGQVMWSVAGVDVDVKSELGPPGLCATSVAEIIARAEERTGTFGFRHLEPEWNDHALMLVLNVFKDGLNAMPWAIEDLRRIAKGPRFDAGALAARAHAGGVATALWVVARWLVETQGANAWREVTGRMGERPPSARAARVYALWQRAGCPRYVGHFLVPMATDDLARSVAAIGDASAGIVRGYGLRAIDAARALRGR
jgi:hypothetical protein